MKKITALRSIEDSAIEAGMVGDVLNVDDLGNTWVVFETSECETTIQPFTPDELAEFTE